jgi:uncharacterized protein
MDEVAFLRSSHIPSAAIFLDGRLKHPFRIYKSDEKNLLVATTEVPVAKEGMYAVSSCLLDWASEQGCKEVVVLDGIPVKGLPSERKILFATEEEKMKELDTTDQFELLQKGIIGGISGSVLSESLVRRMVGFTLLTPAISVMPDPEGASILLKGLNELYDLGINVSELEESAEEIRKKMKEMAKQVQQIRQQVDRESDDTYERIYA